MFYNLNLLIFNYFGFNLGLIKLGFALDKIFEELINYESKGLITTTIFKFLNRSYLLNTIIRFKVYYYQGRVYSIKRGAKKNYITTDIIYVVFNTLNL